MTYDTHTAWVSTVQFDSDTISLELEATHKLSARSHRLPSFLTPVISFGLSAD